MVKGVNFNKRKIKVEERIIRYVNILKINS